LYQDGESKQITVDRPGLVNVYCNIHPEMAAKIKVLDNRFFAVTTKDGKFRITGVPMGAHPLVAWHPNGDEWHGTVVVSADQVPPLPTTSLDNKPASKKHNRKDGSPYPRYQ